MELRQIVAATAIGTQSEQTPLKPGGCPGGCGLCCGVASLAASRSIHGLLAADAEGSRPLYDPHCWSWEQLRQLILAPEQTGFHVSRVSIRDGGDILAVDGSFDIAILGLVPSTIPTLDGVVQSLVRCVCPGGLAVVLQPFALLRQLDPTGIPVKTGAVIAHCIEAFRASGCKEIVVLRNSSTRTAMCDSCLGPGSECDHPVICKSTHPAGLVVLVESA